METLAAGYGGIGREGHGWQICYDSEGERFGEEAGGMISFWGCFSRWSGTLNIDMDGSDSVATYHVSSGCSGNSRQAAIYEQASVHWVEG